MSPTSTDTMLDEEWMLSPAVALRPEPFGAMAYHFGNRKLTFLKKPELVRVIRSLEGSGTVRDALVQSGVPEGQWPAYVGALRSLAATDMIRASKGKNND
ncbi:mycofactocin biosynthesis chaperone MftB [Arthrobacter sp. OV608]|uniref:mycofactocin biosynthesis chaperone MftB n=1 Tax=Arthrobacter sp. OV608 TaxID=1882768 RepID=UPI0008D1A014|nr:mycofactocin biosynthesis chaperone MftB [Arthrobacter sp. OV608]SER28421.1 putative mycofactocin binding protein MftB [Arthrobacter sp. OV608]